MPEIRTIVVDEEAEGTRADRFLGEELEEYSRSYLQQLISDGKASIQGKPVKCSRKLKAGEEIVIEIPDPVVPEILPEKIPLDILYEDDDVLIVNKGKNMAVHPAPGHESGTLVNAVMAHCGDSLSGINGILRPGIVHRIDKDTTGALIICKNDRAHRDIAEQLKEHSATRRYRGVVIGSLRDDEGRIEGNIGRNPHDRKKMAVVIEGGKPAVTHYRVLQRYGNYTYCEFRLETGRTHQIRVHMASIGHPLVGDPLYGPAKSPFRLNGQALHAMVIGFRHPADGRYCEFEAPLPDEFSGVLKKLENQSKLH